MQTFQEYSKNFLKKADENGYSLEEINICLSYAKRLFQNNTPVIYSISHLSALVGYNSNYIKKASVFTRYFYRKFEVPKKGNGIRVIMEPLTSLKEIQGWILKNILSKIKVSKYAKAYLANTGLIENVKYHVPSKVVLTIDLKDFFPSINYKNVYKIYRDCGYSEELSHILSKLTTLQNALPQGAPTSPYLSNLIMKNFDDCIGTFSKENNIRYTRYADDITFSGINISKNILLEKVNEELIKINEKISINNEKVKLYKENQKQIVTGVVVNKKAQLAKSDRKNIRLALFYIHKNGLKNHLKANKDAFDMDEGKYIKHLLGKINFGLYLNPKDQELKRYKNYIYENYPPNII